MMHVTEGWDNLTTPSVLEEKSCAGIWPVATTGWPAKHRSSAIAGLNPPDHDT